MIGPVLDTIFGADGHNLPGLRIATPAGLSLSTLRAPGDADAEFIAVKRAQEAVAPFLAAKATSPSPPTGVGIGRGGGFDGRLFWRRGGLRKRSDARRRTWYVDAGGFGTTIGPTGA